MNLGLTDRNKKDKMVKLSEPTIGLLKEAKTKIENTTGVKVPYDSIIKMALDKPTLIVIQNQQDKRKKPVSKDLWGEDIGVL
jgi:hypothetical protein